MECFFKENIWQNVNNKMFYEKFFSFRPSLEKSLAWNKLMAQISFITTKSLPIHNNPIPSRSDYIYLSIYLSSIYLPICLSLFKSIYLYINLYIYIYLSVCLFICMSVCLSVYQSIWTYERETSVCLCVGTTAKNKKFFRPIFIFLYYLFMSVTIVP